MTIRIENARIIAPDDVIEGGLVVEGGVFTEIGATTSGEDFGGDLVIPGLVDIHTDNLEKHFYPRAGVDWDPVSAAIIHDGQCVSVGLTTIFDSLSVGSWGGQEARHLQNMLRLVGGLDEADQKGLLRANHFLHWRCETSNPMLGDMLTKLLPSRMTGLLSVMDHTPGQRQYPDLERHKKHWREHLDLSEEEIEARIAQALENQARFTPINRDLVSKAASERGLPLASHDDQLAEHVDDALSIRAMISEFPTTMDAARLAKEYRMTVVMGAPNLMRGGSYSGNASAGQVAAEGLLDAFASDYVPRAMIEAAFRLTEAPFSWDLPRAVRTVTAAPADSVGLTDRGRIDLGKRADFVRVRLEDGRPLVRGVWVAGERVG